MGRPCARIHRAADAMAATGGSADRTLLSRRGRDVARVRVPEDGDGRPDGRGDISRFLPRADRACDSGDRAARARTVFAGRNPGAVGAGAVRGADAGKAPQRTRHGWEAAVSADRAAQPPDSDSRFTEESV